MPRTLDLMQACVARDGTASDRIRTMAFSSVALQLAAARAAVPDTTGGWYNGTKSGAADARPE